MRAQERLLNYIAYDTTSNEENHACPSTPGQLKLAEVLVSEMRAMGITDTCADEHGYVYGSIPASAGCEHQPVIGLIAHMDTSPSASGKDIHAKIVPNYDGGTIVLNEAKNIMMSPKEYESLADYLGQDLIVTDGTTLLGADDKAGIAEVLTAAEQLLQSGRPHGKVAIAFTPDEEIGRGADLFDVPRFGADFAYTVDGGKLGELEYENFNAAAAKVAVNGVNIHPGDAKGKMKNSLLIAMEFNAMLPAFEIPANTEGYEGFHHLCGMQGDEEKTVMQYIIRDHDKEKFKQKKARFEAIVQYLNEKYGEDTVVLMLKDSYYNMKEQIEPHIHIIDRAKQAMLHCGVTPRVVPIRGGTDGARLSFMGLPCPNLSIGGHNFHGRFEYIPIQSMDKMVEVLLQIIAQEN